MHSHLVAVEVGIEGCTCQRMELDGFSFNHFRLECLNTQSVKGRCTVEEHRMSFHDIFKDIPDDRFTTVYNLLGTLNRFDNTALDEFANNKRLIKFGGHKLGQTALTHFQFRTNNDYRTCGIIDTLTEKILAETSLLTFEIVGKGLERTVAVALHSTALAGVIEKAVDGFLKHTLLITQNDVRGLNLEQTLETVVTDKHTTIKIIKVGGSETTTVKCHQRTQIGRSDRNDFHNHPFRTVTLLAGAECLYDLKTLESFVLALNAGVGIGTVAEFV